MNFPRKKLAVNGISMNVIDAGEGPALLLVHGFPDSSDVWREQVPALVAAGYRVIAPDTRGCGHSDAPQQVADYGVQHLVADLAALLDALGLEQVQLVGHDWGALICWYFVMAHPERVSHYVAMSVGHPRAYATAGVRQKLKGYYVMLFQLRGVAECLLRLGDWRLFGWLTGLPSELPHWRRLLRRPGRLTAAISYYRANLHLLWRKDYPRVTVPVTGIYSDGDRFLTRSQMSASAGYCDAGFRVLELDGVGHWMQLEAPQRVNPLLINVLKGEA